MKKEFLNLSIPNILSNLTVPLVSLVDVGLMGRMPSSEYIVAIGLATVIFNFLYWAFGFLRMGTTGLVAQAFGSNNKVKQQELLAKSLSIGLGIGFFLITTQWFLLKFSLYIFESPSTTELLIENYFQVRIFAAPATIGLYGILGWLLGMQNAKMALVLSLIVNLFNAGLSYVLISRFDLSITGAALGTVIAQYIGLLSGIIIIKRQYGYISFKLLNFIKSSKNEWLEFFRVNADLFIRTLCLIFTLSFFKIKAAELGELVGAANILLLEFITISAYGIDGLAFASESIVGKYYGMRNKNLLMKAIKISLWFGCGFGFLISLCFYYFGEDFLHLLTNKNNIIETALVYLPWLAIAPIINSLAFIWDGIYIGATASNGMKVSLMISTLLFLPSFYLFSNYWGNHGIWLALTIFMLTRGVLQTLWAKKYVLNSI